MSLKASEVENILFIELDNLENGNSFGLAEAQDLSDIYYHWKDTFIYGMVFSSTSRHLFCAGGNLKLYASHPTAREGKLVNRQISKALDLLSNWAVPTVVAVEGDCFGGGMELLSCFDHVVATPQSFFGLWQRRIGLSYGWGGGKRFRQTVSAQQLKNLSLSTQSFTASKARTFGFVNDVVSAERIYEAVLNWLKPQELLAKAPVAAFKSFTDDQESDLFEDLWWEAEHRGVLNKILARRGK